MVVGYFMGDECKPDSRMRASVPRNVRFAIECESSTNGDVFFRDFSKLVNVRSDVKLYLGGLNQKTLEGALNYMKKRCSQAFELIQASGDGQHTSDWFIGFWPSPQSYDASGASLWSCFVGSERTPRFDHLNRIYLYRLSQSQFSHLE